MALAKDIAVMRVGSDGVVRFTFGEAPTYVSGGARVAQLYLLALLSEAGSMVGHPNYGGNLLSLAGSSYGFDSEIKTLVASAVSKARDDVLREQNLLQLEASDRLSRVNIQEMSFIESSRTLKLVLEITNEAGSSIIVNLS